MHLQYNGVDLQIERTADFSMKPVRDPTGLDTTMQEVVLGMTCVWNPKATTSNPPDGQGGIAPFIASAPNLRAAGDALGVSIQQYAKNNLRQALLTPRQQLYVWIANDLVFDVPGQATWVNQATGEYVTGRSTCDPAGGPFPEEVRVLEIHGDKTAIVYFRIRFYVTDCNNWVLSNRWRMTSQMDEQFVTTRVTEGRAILRIDYLWDAEITADQFRASFIVPVPDGFVRKKVDVVATEDGKEVHYVAVDHQVQRNLGSVSDFGTSWAVKVEGNATAGVDWPINQIRAALIATSAVQNAVADRPFLRAIVENMWGGPLTGFIMQTDTGKSLLGVGLAALASCKATVVVKVYGVHVTDQSDAPAPQNNPGGAGIMNQLAQLAANIAIDRLWPIWNMSLPLLPSVHPIVSAYMTQDFGSDNAPYVEMRMELMPVNQRLIDAVLNPVVGNNGFLSGSLSGLMNMTTGYNNSPVFAGTSSANVGTTKPMPNEPPPYSSASRGDYTTYLVTQALTTKGCQLIQDVPDAGFFPGDPTFELPTADDGDFQIA